LTLHRPVTATLHTAAEIYGFDTSGDPRTHVLGVVRSTLGDLVLHRHSPLLPVRRHGAVDVLDPAETAVRTAGLAANPPRALACLDAALRSAYTTPAELAAVAGEAHIDRIGLIRDLIPLADRRPESPPESWLRWLCHDAGFPPLVPQLSVQCAAGVWFRIDLAWPEIRLGLEYDGVQFHTGPALTAARHRYNALTAAGWTILSVTAPMLWSGRSALVSQIGGELRRLRSEP
jgi:hypothetical protein